MSYSVWDCRCWYNRGRGNKVLEMLTHQKLDLCCLQDTRCRGGLAHLVKGKDSTHKFFRSGDLSGFGGIGIMLAEKWINNVISVTRYDCLCLQLRFLVGIIIVNVISCYASQSCQSAEEKDAFYNKIISLVAAVPNEEVLLIRGDFNGHVGKHSAGFEGVHGGNVYDVINQDGL